MKLDRETAGATIYEKAYKEKEVIFTGLEAGVELAEERKGNEREGAQKMEKNISLKDVDSSQRGERLEGIERDLDRKSGQNNGTNVAAPSSLIRQPLIPDSVRENIEKTWLRQKLAWKHLPWKLR